MTNLEALNSLAEKVGGEAQESNAKAIKEIADNFSGGCGGGGGEIYDVTVTFDPSDPSAIATTATTAEVQAAWDAGKKIRITVEAGAGMTFFDAFVISLGQAGWNALHYDQGTLFGVTLFKMENTSIPMDVSSASYVLTEE